MCSSDLDYKHQRHLEEYLKRDWTVTARDDPEEIIRVARKYRDHWNDGPRDDWADRHGDVTYYHIVCEDKHDYIGSAKREYNAEHSLADEEPLDGET